MLQDMIAMRLLRLVELARSTNVEQIVGQVLVALLIASVLKGDNKKNIANIPIHDGSRLKPAIVSQSRFVTEAKHMISSGYKKASNFHMTQVSDSPVTISHAKRTKVQRIAIHIASL